MIALFLAVLEMVKLQAVVVLQKDLFGEIALKRHKQFDAVFAAGAADDRDREGLQLRIRDEAWSRLKQRTRRSPPEVTGDRAKLRAAADCRGGRAAAGRGRGVARCRRPPRMRASRPCSKRSSTSPKSRSRWSRSRAGIGQPRERVEKLLDELVAEFDKPEHGVTIREVAGGYKMATKAEHHEAVRNFVKSLKPPLKLSLPALETLAVIAYKQPVTAPEIMEIRGVQGAGVLKTLLDRKLIAAAGRKNVIGKPILYKTTKEFLVQFGLKDLSELPSLKEFEEIRRMAIADGEMMLPFEAPEPPARQPSRASPAGSIGAGAELAAPPESRTGRPKPRLSRNPTRADAGRATAENPFARRRRLPPQGRADHPGRPRHRERRRRHRAGQQGRSRSRSHQGGRQAAARSAAPGLHRAAQAQQLRHHGHRSAGPRHGDGSAARRQGARLSRWAASIITARACCC